MQCHCGRGVVCGWVSCTRHPANERLSHPPRSLEATTGGGAAAQDRCKYRVHGTLDGTGVGGGLPAPACLFCKCVLIGNSAFRTSVPSMLTPQGLPGGRCYGDGVPLLTVYFLTAMTENDVDRPYSVSPNKAASSGMWK